MVTLLPYHQIRMAASGSLGQRKSRIRKHQSPRFNNFLRSMEYNIIWKHQMIFKVVFGKQIHLVNSQDKQELAQLLKFIPTVFKGLPNRFTITYYDEDGDEISLRGQEDYEVLLSTNLKTVKINVRQSFDEPFDQTNEIVIQEMEEIKELKQEEKKAEEKLDEIKESQEASITQEIEDSLIEEKIRKMIPDLISRIKTEISEEILEKSKLSSISSQPIIVEEPIFHKKEQKEEPNNDRVVHKGVTCGSCQFRDIEGVRYKCSVCSNFDFCESCEATVEHPHPFLKIKTLKQTPLKIFTVIDEDTEPSVEVNGQRFEVPASFEGLLNHGLGLVQGFFGGENRESFRNRCQAAKAEWMKHNQEWKKAWKCTQNCEEKQEKKPEAENTEEPKIETKTHEKPERKSEEYDVIKANANYLVEVFGYSFEKCLKWAQMYPYMSKQELLNFCLASPSFYN